MADAHSRRFVTVYSYKCNVSCEHCITNSDVHGKLTVPRDLAERCYQSAFEAGFTFLGISGGEPFLFPDDLVRFTQLSESLQAPFSIITNAFWGRHLERAKTRLRTLHNLERLSLSISTDKFHARFIPYETVLQAYAAARSLGIEASFRITLGAAADPELDEFHAFLHDQHVPHDEQPLLQSGYAARLPDEEFLHERPCDPVTCGSIRQLILDPRLRIHACSGAALNFSSSSPLVIADLSVEDPNVAIARAIDSSLFDYLEVFGPTVLARELASRGVISLPPSLASRADSNCEICRIILDHRWKDISVMVEEYLSEPGTRARVAAARLVRKSRDNGNELSH